MTPTTAGTLLGGRIVYTQRTDGYRTGIEPVLLAAAVPARPGDRVLEAGTGAGAGLLCLLARVSPLAAVGVELDPEMAALARSNLSANGHPCDIECADVSTAPSLGPFDHVFANPPWHDDSSTPSPDQRRSLATHAASSELTRWIATLTAALRPRGSLTVIVPAARLGRVIAALQTQGMGRTALTLLWPRPSQPARLAVLVSHRGSGPFRIGPGLVLHGPGQGYTPEADAVLRGGAPLPA